MITRKGKILNVKQWLELNSERLVIVLLHLVAWGLYLAFYWISWIQVSPNKEYRIMYILVIAIKDVPLFYFFYLRAIPRLLTSRKGWLFVLLALLLAGLYPLVSWCFDQILIYFYSDTLTPFVNISTSQFWNVFGIRALSALFVILMAGIGKFTFDWFKNMRIRRELENQNLTSELAFLKSQINPHFLFNTLNNIHTLAYKKADGAPEAIMKLSELMRYMLYDSDVDKVPLATELMHLESFIGLQQLRFKSKDIVHLEVKGEPEKHTIAPLLLLPFVENAFKHGYQLNRAGAIRICLNAGDELVFTVENERPPEQAQIQKDQVGGIGLENISRRLQLIYGLNAELYVESNTKIFRAKLTLKNG